MKTIRGKIGEKTICKTTLEGHAENSATSLLPRQSTLTLWVMRSVVSVGLDMVLWRLGKEAVWVAVKKVL